VSTYTCVYRWITGGNVTNAIQAGAAASVAVPSELTDPATFNLTLVSDVVVPGLNGTRTIVFDGNPSDPVPDPFMGAVLQDYMSGAMANAMASPCKMDPVVIT